MSADPTRRKSASGASTQTRLSPSPVNRTVDSDPDGWRNTEPVSKVDLERGMASSRHAPATLTTLMGRSFGKRYHLGAETLIGRSGDCTIRLAAADASRHHARITREESGRFTLRDLGSHNGTRVDGERIVEYILRAGDRVAIGAETVFLFSLRSREEEEIVEVQKMESMGQLAGGIAHDFNNLLAAIIGNAELARECVKEVSEAMPLATECLDDVLGAADRARDLVRQLLGFARRGNWEEAPADVAVVVGEVLRLLSRTFDPNIEIDVDTVDGLFVVGDRSQLFQMLMNLCINSRDAMAGGGRLTVKARLSDPAEARDGGRHVLITVQDTGLGMDEETRERIFEPFFSTKERGRGTGLGLAVVYGIVTSHGGRIWARSEVGVGTQFRVSLPAMDEAPEQLDDMTATIRPGILAETRNKGRDLVLVIDDEAVVRRSLGRTLRSLDFDVVDAEDGPCGVALFREHSERIALVILDLIMPGMDGEQVLAVLMGIDPRVCVVIVSGYHDDAKVSTLSRAGAAGFLPKPFTGLALRFTIEAALAKNLLE
jgi:signal transduction histidine kinase/ActR/RegA family two-component response regulator